MNSKNEAPKNIHKIHSIEYRIAELNGEQEKIKSELLEARALRITLRRQFDFIKTQKDADELQELANLFPEIIAGRHLQIIKLMLQFKSAQEIADLCFLSEKTVKYHKTLIYNRLDCMGEKGLFKMHVERLAKSKVTA